MFSSYSPMYYSAPRTIEFSFVSDEFINSIKKLITEKFSDSRRYSSSSSGSISSLSKAELLEVFTLPSAKASAPKYVGVDFTRLKLIGDGVLDASILKILAKRGVIDGLHEAKCKLTGNEPDQPLNKLFNEWMLSQLIVGTETELSPHQKADVMEALFGLLSMKEILIDEMVERIFAPYLPVAVSTPAERKETKITLDELIELPAETLKIFAKTNRDDIERHSSNIILILLDRISKASNKDIEIWVDKVVSLAEINGIKRAQNNVIRVLVEKIRKSPIEEIDSLLKNFAKLSHAFREYNEYGALLKDESFSLEKFAKLAQYIKPADDRFTGLNPADNPLEFLKLESANPKQALSKFDLLQIHRCLEKLAAEHDPNKQKMYGLILEKAFSLGIPFGDAILINYKALRSEKKALLPSYAPLDYFPVSVYAETLLGHVFKSNPAAMNQLLGLSIEEFRKGFKLLHPECEIVKSTKQEVENRMKISGYKKREHYQQYLDCLTPSVSSATLFKDGVSSARALPSAAAPR